MGRRHTMPPVTALDLTNVLSQRLAALSLSPFGTEKGTEQSDCGSHSSARSQTTTCSNSSFASWTSIDDFPGEESVERWDASYEAVHRQRVGELHRRKNESKLRNLEIISERIVEEQAPPTEQHIEPLVSRMAHTCSLIEEQENAEAMQKFLHKHGFKH